MAAKKTAAVEDVAEVAAEETKTKATSKNEVAEFKSNLIALGNLLIKQVEGKQVPDINGTLGRIVEIFNAVK